MLNLQHLTQFPQLLIEATDDSNGQRILHICISIYKKADTVGGTRIELDIVNLATDGHQRFPLIRVPGGTICSDLPT